MSAHLRLDELSISFAGPRGIAPVIDGVSLEIAPGSIMGLVGESGSGKTVVAKALVGLFSPAASVDGGSIRFGESDLLDRRTRRPKDRGPRISMIFQNPRSSLNPIRKVGRQIEDVVHRYQSVSGSKARKLAIEALASVRFPDPERLYHAYPFELSGGMAQRALIAVALASNPSLLIADEPTTGLDVSLQREIMELIKSISVARTMSVLLITHDLAVAEEYCDRIAVMHAGHIVETAEARALVEAPRHPYTSALIRSMPSAISDLASLNSIAGTLPDLYDAVPACRFLARCDRSDAACAKSGGLVELRFGDDHTVLCRKPL